MRLSLLLTAQVLYTLASEHNAEGRYISEYNEVQRASYYMVAYRKCEKENK